MALRLFFFVLCFSPLIGFTQNCPPILTDFSSCGTQVIAHRGYSHIYPENTLQGLEEAFIRGIKLAEVDINVTLDSVLILFHDQPGLSRTTNSNATIQFSSFDDLSGLDYGFWKASPFKSTPLTTLKEAMILADEYGAQLYLDTKHYSPNLMAQLISETQVPPNTILPAVNGFPEAQAWKEACPSCSFVYFGDWRNQINDPSWFQQMIDLGCVAFEIYFEAALENELTFQNFRDLVHQVGAALWVFTTNDLNQATTLAQLGVDAIESDIPWEMAKHLCDPTNKNGMDQRCTGNWNFSDSDLLSQHIGSQLKEVQFTEEFPKQNTTIASCSNFNLPFINGQNVQVLKIPAYNPSNGLMVYNNFTPQGLADLHHNYTVAMDILIPSNSLGNWISLLQTNPDNINDGDIFINPSGAIGINNEYHGQLTPNKWHRLVLSISANEINKYVDGIWIGKNEISGNRWSTINTFPGGDRQGAYLFTDEDGESETMHLAALQIRNYPMTATEISELGTPSPNGFQNPNSELFNPISSLFPNATFIQDWAEKRIYIPEELSLTPVFPLNFELSGGATSTLNSGSLITPTTSQIRVTSEDGLHQTTWSFCPTSTTIEKKEETAPFSIYPNPSQGGFQLLGKLNSIQEVSILTIDGKILERYSLNNPLPQTLGGSDKIGPGIYLIQISDGTSSSIITWVKQP